MSSVHFRAFFPPAVKSSSWNRKIETPRSHKARHLLDDGLWASEPGEAASLRLVERADAAEVAIPRTSPAAQDRCGRSGSHS